MSVWPTINTGGPPSSTFLSGVAVTANQALTSGGDEVRGHRKLSRTPQGVSGGVKVICGRHLDMPTEIYKSGLVGKFPIDRKSIFKGNPFENRSRKKVTDLWRFMSVWPEIHTGGPSIAIFEATASVAASRKLLSGGDDVRGYSKLSRTPQGVLDGVKVICGGHLDLALEISKSGFGKISTIDRKSISKGNHLKIDPGKK